MSGSKSLETADADAITASLQTSTDTLPKSEAYWLTRPSRITLPSPPRVIDLPSEETESPGTLFASSIATGPMMSSCCVTIDFTKSS